LGRGERKSRRREWLKGWMLLYSAVTPWICNRKIERVGKQMLDTVELRRRRRGRRRELRREDASRGEWEGR